MLNDGKKGEEHEYSSIAKVLPVVKAKFFRGCTPAECDFLDGLIFVVVLTAM
jgi:hypothetical protein